MASGSFGVTTNNQYINGYVSWESTAYTDSNKSWVSAVLYLHRTNSGYTTSGTGTWYMTINGVTGSNTQSFTIVYNTYTEMVRFGTWVDHEADGTKSITISVSGKMANSASSLQATYGNTTVNLDTIPRASQPSLNAYEIELGESIIIYTNRASSSFFHNISYQFEGTSGVIASNVGTETNWNISLDFANYLPRSTEGYMTINCDTYSGETYIGSKSTVLKVLVPSWIGPSFESVSHTELNSAVTSAVGKYIQSLSSIRLSITNPSGSYSSSIASYSINYGGSHYASSSLDTGTIQWYGSISVTGTITDSRGRSFSKNVTIDALPYNIPSITGFTLTRCSQDKNNANNYIDDPMGSFVKIISSGNSSSLVNISEKNNLTYTLYSKNRTQSSWTIIKSAQTINGLFLNATDILGTFNATSSFDFMLSISDRFNTTFSRTILPTGHVSMSWGKEGIGVGKVWESGALDVNGDVNILGNVILKKNGNWSNIMFDPETNDPAFIKHYEDNNNAVMYFSVSDDKGTQDYYSFGSTPNGAYSEGTRIYTNGRIDTDMIIVPNWFRSIGDTGWYSETYGGGWHMTDTNWIRAFNGKNIYTTGQIKCDNGFTGGLGRVPAYTWSGTLPGDASNVYITHSLGYYPIIQFDGNLGNIILTTTNEDINTVRVCNWNSGVNDWTGTIRFY